MDNYIADGEIHPLEPSYSIKQAYLFKKLDPETNHIAEFTEIRDEWVEKIASYIMECNKEEFFEILLKHYGKQYFLDLMQEALKRGPREGFFPTINYNILNTQMTYRPPESASFLANFATLAIRFDRVEGDEEWFEDKQKENENEKDTKSI